MAEQAGLIHGSYALQGMGGTGSTTTTKKDKTSTKAINFTDFVQAGTELPTTIKGFRTKQSEYYEAKTVVENLEDQYNIALEQSLKVEHGGNVESWFDANAEVMLQARMDINEKKNAVLAMHNRTEQEWKEFEEGDLYEMAGGTTLHDDVGNVMMADDFLKESTLQYMMGTRPDVVAGLMGLNPDEMPKNMDSDEFAEYISQNKKPVAMTRDMYLSIQDILPYGVDFENVDGIDTEAYLSSFQDAMKNYGETVLSTKGNEYVTKTSGPQIEAGIDYFHQNVVPLSPELRRTRTALTNGYQARDAGIYNNMSEQQHEEYNKNLDNISGMLTEMGYETYDDLYYNMGTMQERLKDSGNKEWDRLLKRPEEMRRTLLWANWKDGGSTLSDETVNSYYLGNLKAHEQTVLEGHYKVQRNNPANKIYTDLDEAARGDINSLPKIDALLVTTDEKSRVIEAAKQNKIESVVQGHELSYAIGYMGDKVLDSDWTLEQRKDFFHGEGNEDRLNEYVLAKSMGGYFDKFITHMVNNNKSLDGIVYQGGMQKQGKVQITGQGGGRLVELYDGQMRNIKAGIEVKDINEGYTTFNPTEPDKYVHSIWVGVDGKNSYSMSMQEMINTDQFKEWAESNLSEEDRTKMYSVDNYLYNHVTDKTPETDIKNYVAYNVNKGNKGRFPVNMRSLTNYSGKDGLTGTIAAFNNKKIFNPITLEEDVMPFSGKIVGVDAVASNLNMKDKDQQYVYSFIAVSKEDAENLEYVDHEGNPTKYSDVYNFDEWSFEALRSSRPDLINGFYGSNVAARSGALPEGYEDMMVINLPVKITDAFWHKTLMNMKLDLPEQGNQGVPVTNNQWATMHGTTITSNL